MKPLKLKRHETFSIREGWLEKGINNLDNNGQCFKKEDGPRVLGLGSNMCKSLRYWLIATGLAEFKQTGAELTEFGKLIMKYDRYLESDFSWFMIHLFLARNKSDAPVINKFFNLKYQTFDKDFIVRCLKENFENEGYSVGSDLSLDSDVSILIKSYLNYDNSNPEENLNCPLAKLGFLNTIDKKTYHKSSPAYKRLNYRIIYYSIIMCCQDNKLLINDAVSFNIEDLYLMENNPLCIFNINKSTLFLYLDEMERNGLIKVSKTAGLNTVYINKDKHLDALFKSYFRSVDNV